MVRRGARYPGIAVSTNDLAATALATAGPPISWHAAMHDREIEEVVSTLRPVRGEVPFTGTAGRRIYDYIFVPVTGANGEVELVAGTTVSTVVGIAQQTQATGGQTFAIWVKLT